MAWYSLPRPVLDTIQGVMPLWDYPRIRVDTRGSCPGVIPIARGRLTCGRRRCRTRCAYMRSIQLLAAEFALALERQAGRAIRPESFAGSVQLMSQA